MEAGADIEDQLSNFLDDKDFQYLASRFGRFNLFEAVGSVRRELNHSNFLAFLLSPNRPHGLGTGPLRRVLRKIVQSVEKDRRPVRPLDVVVGELEDAIIHRERYNIDLLIELHELRLVVVIENKVGAEAGDGQLQRYADIIRQNYPDWRSIFVFLTPEGRVADHPDYIPFSYTDLSRIVDELAQVEGQQSEIGLILRHYAEMLKVHVVEDDELKQLAQRIYEQHREALNFIFQSRPEPSNYLGLMRDLIKERPELKFDRQIPSIARFAPAAWMVEPLLNSAPPEAWTKTRRNLIFEIKSFKTETYDFSDRVLLSLILGPSDQALREHFFNSARADKDIFVGLGWTVGKQWATLFSKELLSKNAAESMDEEQKIAALTASWGKFVADDLPKLTEAILGIARRTPTA